MMDEEDMGASASRPGSRPADHAPSGHGAPRFDPSRVVDLYANEELILATLDDAYQRGRLEYLHYSPARDATLIRMAALSWHLPRAPQAAGPEGRERGPKASPNNPKGPQND